MCNNNSCSKHTSNTITYYNVISYHYINVLVDTVPPLIYKKDFDCDVIDKPKTINPFTICVCRSEFQMAPTEFLEPPLCFWLPPENQITNQLLLMYV